MAGWTLRPGAAMSIAWAGQVHHLILEDITLESATVIHWQPSDRPLKLKSVTLHLREQTADERTDQQVTAPQRDVLDAVADAVAELDSDDA